MVSPPPPHTHTHSHTHTLPLPHTYTEERRLFVGMLCRNLSEDDVKALFNTYGAVDDVSILRNADGKSKGTAISYITAPPPS